jgi:hypothetical protein
MFQCFSRLSRRLVTFIAGVILVSLFGIPEAWSEPQAAPEDQPSSMARFSITRVVRVDSRQRVPPIRAGIRPPILEAMSGDELLIFLAGTTPSSARFEAVFTTPNGQGQRDLELRSLGQQQSATTLLVRTPVVEVWQMREMRIVATVAGQAAGETNSYPVRIAPPANAVIESISPPVVQVGSSVKVTGQGFYAPPEQIVLTAGDISVEAERVSPLGDWFSVHIPERRAGGGDRPDAGSRNVGVTVWGVPAQIPEELREASRLPQLTIWRQPGTRTELLIAASAATTGIFVVGLLVILYRTLKRRRRGLVAALLYEPESQTYSLSRAQFFWWTTIIAYGYLFLFFGHGLHQGAWNFPPLEGFAYTFLISLGTLVLAQATSSFKGSKGAGVVHPAPADLIVHGGVLAPERVQQVVWTLLAGIAFLWIVIKTYTTSTGLPTIPTEMLALMGISSAGYLGGKLARKPGPIIKSVEVSPGSVVLRIFGEHLSLSPRVLVDSVELSKNEVATLEADPDHRNEFVKALKVTVPESIAKTPAEWYARPRVVVVVNEDTQRAEWEIEVPKIMSIDVSEADERGKRRVTITGEDIGAGATLLLPGANEEIQITQDPASPESRWFASVGDWPDKPVEVLIKTANRATVTHMVAPPGSTKTAGTASSESSGGNQDTSVEDDAHLEGHRAAADESAESSGTVRNE